MIYTYDGTFYGFLSVVFAHYYDEPAVEVYRQDWFDGSLIDTVRFIETDSMKAVRVERALRSKCSRATAYTVYYAFLASNRFKDCYLLSYIELAFKLGKEVDQLYATDQVIRVRQLSKKVGNEKHRYLGALRFREVNTKEATLLYAPFSPENDVLVLLGAHFADRYRSERIIIHDIKRRQALLAHQGKWLISDYQEPDLVEFSREEVTLQHLWKGYFEHIAIDHRKSRKRQNNRIPLKYRPYMVEFDEQVAKQN